MARTPSDETWMLLDSSGIGGIESHVLHLAEALQSRWGKVRVVFYANHGEHPLIRQLDEAGIAWEHLNGSLRSLLAALSRRPKLLHTHGYKAGILGRLAAFLCRVPVVSTFHAGEPGTGMVRLYNALDSLTANLGEAIAVSSQIQKRLPGRPHLVRNFVPVADGANERQAAAIAFVGRLSHEKGPDLFCQLAERLPQAPFVIYGDGPMRADLEKRFGGRVRFMGQVSGMEPHWPDIGLLCMPSRHEGLPYAALEAMAHGVPVAAFDVGGLAKVVEHGRNGWIAPPGDSNALGDDIRRWCRLDTQTRAGMSAQARRTVKQGFSPQAVVPGIIEIYRKTLSDKGRPDTPARREEKPC